MKIGILTFYRVPNYGAMLQAYALWKYLERRGHHVEFIDYAFPNVKRIPLWRCFVSRSLKGFRVKLRTYVRYPITAFAQSYPQSKLCATCSELHEVCKAYDAVIVGSDQMWNPQWVMPILDVVFLGCLPEKCRRIAYASSFGVKMWQRGEQEKVAQLLKKFTAISVRETTGVEIVRGLGCPDVQQMLDPTLLWTADFYKQLMVRKQKTEDYLFAYFLDEWADGAEEQACINACVSVTGLTKVRRDREPVLGCLALLCLVLQIRTKPPLPEWIECVANADFILTNSFHGTVFAILFHRPFITLLLTGTAGAMNERVVSLLSLVGLEDRMIYAKDTGCVAKLARDTEINWSTVDRRLVEKREEVIRFLEKCEL